MLLASYGVIPAKIWAFAPGIFSVDDSSLISIPDKNMISATGHINWGFHVVPFIMVNQNGHIEPMVFDLALYPNGPVPLEEWKEKLYIPNMLCLKQDWEWYLYNSLPWNLNQLYEDFMNPQNLTQEETTRRLVDVPIHDFFMYELDSKQNHWMEKGLAIDDTAFTFYLNEIKPLQISGANNALLHDYYTLVGDVNNFETVFRDGLGNDEVGYDFQKKHQLIIAQYRTVYLRYLSKWKRTVAKIAQPSGI